MKRTTIVDLIAILYCILFLYTGIAKLMDYYVAEAQIAQTPILAPLASEIAIILPILEIGTALLVFFTRTRKIGLRISLLLMVTFTGYIIYILFYNKELPCTCGGVLQNMTWPQHLLFNLIFIILSILGLILSKKSNKQVSEQMAHLTMF